MKNKPHFFGRTEFMTSVIFEGNFDNIGKIIQVQIEKSNQNTLFGTVLERINKKVA